MIRHIWTVICSRALIDKESNNVSLVEVIEEVRLTPVKSNVEGAVTPFPVTIAWVTTWQREPIEHPGHSRGKDTILSPTGKVVVENEYPIDLSRYKRLRTRRNVANFPVSESGIYSFRTQIWNEEKNVWEAVSDIPVDISVESKRKNRKT